MKRLIAILSFAIFATTTFSQSYMTAGGVRLGTDWGLTIQQRVAKSGTIEGILQSSLQRNEVMVTALYEHHYPMVIRTLNIYVGAGPHKGWIDETNTDEVPAITYKDPFGVSLVLGAELTLGSLNFGYDFKPAINLSGGERKFYSQTGISVRYVFIKNKVYKDIQKKKRKAKRKEEGGIFGKIFKKKD